ncbi:MAG TPA: relaxase/mobilization nuclease domain-containing protein, partial [Thermosynechococcaceae cyanobacterium]
MVNINFTLGMEPLGLTQYLLNPDKQKDSAQAIISTNMGGRDAYELAEEFRFMHDLRPNVKYSVRHFSLSFAPNEQVGDEQFRATVRRLLELTGHQKCPYFAVRHYDQEHKHKVEHGHVAVGTIGFNGRRVSDSNILRRLKQKDLDLGQSIERQLEIGLGLVPAKVRPEAERRNVSTGEYRFRERTEATLPKEKLWDAIDSAASDQPTMPELVTRLKAAGVEVQFHEIDQKHKRKGISFAIDGSKFQGGKLGKAYSLGGLKEHLKVDYEAERDDERLRELNGVSAEECRSRLANTSPQEAASESPEVQEQQPQRFRRGEVILEATESGYQGYGLTEADGEAVERHDRLSIQQAHERELQRQAQERELQQQAERHKQAEDLETRQTESSTSAPTT